MLVPELVEGVEDDAVVAVVLRAAGTARTPQGQHGTRVCRNTLDHHSRHKRRLRRRSESASGQTYLRRHDLGSASVNTGGSYTLQAWLAIFSLINSLAAMSVSTAI